MLVVLTWHVLVSINQKCLMQDPKELHKNSNKKTKKQQQPPPIPLNPPHLKKPPAPHHTQ